MGPIVRVGISLTSRYETADVREGARWMIERAAAAHRAGLDSLFIGDHHVTQQPYYQNVPMLGRLLAEWGDRPAGALFLLPLWHPVLLAEQVGTLASIAQGRFILQAGLGYGEAEFAAMGVPIRQRPSRFEESLDIIRRRLAGARVSSDGRWRFSDARIAPLPPEPVEVWIAATAPPALERAARMGDAWIASPSADLESLETQLRRYRFAATAAGREPDTVAVRRDVYVGESDEEAEATAAPLLAGGYRGFDPSVLVVGGPERVARAFLELGDLGFTDVIVRNLVPDQRQALASIERLAGVRERLLEAPG
jgi:alkanesulfonate monooxygenase SsuD/methylene tetrahydromethanopterin reductase-like flavin-dependent oxidoreductase (luciferase family)